ncbi:MAG: glycoside hydrolase family 15 protein [Acidimicrobiales bacterium]
MTPTKRPARRAPSRRPQHLDLEAAFPPHVLREYALLADGERGILCGPRGDFAWMCAPRWHSDAVFSSLIGGGGLYAVTPRMPRFVWGGYYEAGSLIWRDRWVTSEGTLECREALAFPGDPHRAVILRQVRAGERPARVRILLEARAAFGRHPMTALSLSGGVWSGRTGPLYLRWSGAASAQESGGALVFDLDVEPGGHHDLVLELSDESPSGVDPPPAEAAWSATEESWRRALPELGHSLAPRDATHAYAVLRGLTLPGGGMVAAATMALPERASEGKNYDYRYAWIRDQAYAGEAVAAAVAATGTHGLLDDAVSFIAARLLEDGPGLKPAYRVDGGPVPDERRLAHLSGYPGGFDKVGNWVNHQFQLDAFGEALLVFSAAARHGRLGSEHWRAVEAAVEAVSARWGDPDAGIWELDEQHWTHSRLMCVAGLRAIAPHASAAEAARWSGLADTIAADAAADCVHRSGRWQRSPGDERVDAALLLPALRGAVAARDPRTLATLRAVGDELTEDGYVYRFRQDDRPLSESEGAFLLCGFLMALATHQQGRLSEAVSYFERSRASCGPPGLLTEEFDVGERQLRGNVPQAFVHALLLESACRLSEEPDELGAGGRGRDPGDTGGVLGGGGAAAPSDQHPSGSGPSGSHATKEPA